MLSDIILDTEFAVTDPEIEAWGEAVWAWIDEQEKLDESNRTN